MNVVIYARYSSHNQTEQSIEGQIKVCEEYAKRNNFNIIDIYRDEAKSGTTDNRPSFKQMIEDSKSQKFQGVLVYQLDRFARNRYDSATYKAKLKKNGVRVFSARENISEDASGILMESVLEGMAEYYSAELGQKVQRGMSINAKHCYYNGGTVPLGLKLKSIPLPIGANGKIVYKKKFEIDEEKAPIVQKIFEMYINDYKMADIIRYLNERQIKTSYNQEFNKNSIRTIILNKKYIGIYSYKGKDTPNAIPRIIDDDIFYKAQEKLLKNKAAPSRTKAKVQYLLTTKLFCGTCKEMMVGTGGTSHTGKAYSYYGCKGMFKDKCDRKSVPKDYIENIVIENARNFLTNANINKIANSILELAKKENNNDRVKQLEKRLKKIEKQKVNLFDSLKICYDDNVKKSIFEEISKMENQKCNIENQIAVEKSSSYNVTLDDIKFFLRNLRKGKNNDIRYRQMIINVLVYKVYLYDGNLTIVFNTQDRQYISKIPTINELESSFLGKGALPIRVFVELFESLDIT